MGTDRGLWGKGFRVKPGFSPACSVITLQVGLKTMGIGSLFRLIRAAWFYVSTATLHQSCQT